MKSILLTRMISDNSLTKWILCSSGLIFSVISFLVLSFLHQNHPIQGMEAPKGDSNDLPGTTFTLEKVTSLEDCRNQIQKSISFNIDLSKIDAKMPFAPLHYTSEPVWKILQDIAQASKTQLTLKDEGKTICFVPIGQAAPITTSNGPFRIVLKEIQIREILGSTPARYQLVCDMHWEPKIEVFRIDQPKILSGKDDQSREINSIYSKVFKPVSGYMTPLTLDIHGLKRSSQSILSLEASVTLTFCDELVTFTFDQLGKEQTLKKNHVSVSLQKTASDGKFRSFSIRLGYPEGGAEFESFETYWLRKNSLTLISPLGKRLEVERFESNGNQLTYYAEETKETGVLPSDWKDWKLEYRTPGILRDHAIRFHLNNIPLP